jgi:hypothetical protein
MDARICPDHPTVEIAYPSDLLAHMDAHPGTTTQAVWDALTAPPAAVGAPLRVFRCRYCADVVETTDPDRPTWCDAHLDRAGVTT